MSEAGEKRQRIEGLEIKEPEKIENAQQWYEFAVGGGFGVYFVKPGDKDFPDLHQFSTWAALSTGIAIEKREAVFGNVAPKHVTSVARDRNKIVGLNVGDTSVPKNRFANVSAIFTAKRIGADTVVLCNDSYLAVQPLQVEGAIVHVGVTSITFPVTGDGLGELYTAMGKCLTTFAKNLTASQLKSLCAKAVTVVNLAKTNMRFRSGELMTVLNANDKTELLAAVTVQRSAAKVSDSVLQFCAQLVSVTQADGDPEQFLQILNGLDNPTMAISALTMFGKFPFPSMPKAKDKDMLFVDDRGTKLEVKKLTDVNDNDVVLLNDGAIVAEGQVLSLLSSATTVYVKPPGSTVYFKGKGKGAKYEARQWTSMAAKPIRGLIKMLVAGGLQGPSADKDVKDGELKPADSVDDD